MCFLNENYFKVDLPYIFPNSIICVTHKTCANLFNIPLNLTKSTWIIIIQWFI